ncbi:disulfide bond formation protein DsbB [Lonepinella koalarum]|uniref:Disulfide bond formation protein B n=1 Tax=Lonepinella koalarum TaxID=53417 RepID=A0A4R1KYB0_9PAST|nr:disulfide bond formation protein DsbB [Lonepinella koalarum]MDH2926531.1 disulfide bond formation protein B [Lonepinella koalarum]TCK69533.1 thiol:disulfide interchange protein DsbB [Lonepinella koalarum]TFJ89778.1 disulfide bond formation protein DsbB [Lonepinella koalarum]
MLNYIKVLSSKRTIWWLLFISAFCLELSALYFQHGMGLNPCVMCIYERVALFGILFSGFIGLLAPRFILMRLLALVLGLWGAIKGLLLSIKHLDYQMHPNPWDQCPVTVEFPNTLPLDQWFPAIFHPTGLCSEISWTFLSFTMVQWLVFIFAVYSIIFVIILLSQLLGGRVKNRRRLFH